MPAVLVATVLSESGLDGSAGAPSEALVVVGVAADGIAAMIRSAASLILKRQSIHT